MNPSRNHHYVSLTLAVLVLFLGSGSGPVLADDDHDERHVIRWIGKGGPTLGGAFLGVQALDMTDELRVHYGAPEGAGVLVGRVVEDSAASAAGLRVGDILTEIDGKQIERPSALIFALRGREEGDDIALQVWRDGSPLELTAKLQKRTGPHFQTLGPGLHFLPELDFNFEGFDPQNLPKLENLEGLGQHLGEYFSSPEWQESMRKMGSYRGDLKERLEEMEKRLEEMEKRLEKAGGDS